MVAEVKLDCSVSICSFTRVKRGSDSRGALWAVRIGSGSGGFMCGLRRAFLLEGGPQAL